jgi:CheY-like chemotaxis protein
MSSRHIVIVDDQHEVRRVLRSGIESLGPEYRVLDIPSAEEALLVLFRQKIDLLITDVRLPGISGLELIERVKKRNPSMKVILITGLDDQQTRRQVVNAGAYAFFIKPISMADFLDGVERALGVVETLLPPEPILEEIPDLKPNLPERLINIRQGMGALGVGLVEMDGTVIAEAGSLLSGATDHVLAEDIAGILIKGLKICQSQKGEEGLYCFPGKSFHILVAHTGDASALVMILSPEKDPLISLQKVRSAAREISLELNRPSDELGIGSVDDLPGRPAELETPGVPEFHPEEEEISPEELESVEALFTQNALGEMGVKDLDNFWDSLADHSEQESGWAGALTYEEARKLGLAPDEKEI